MMSLTAAAAPAQHDWTPTDPVQYDWTPTDPVQHDCWGEEDFAAAPAEAAAPAKVPAWLIAERKRIDEAVAQIADKWIDDASPAQSADKKMAKIQRCMELAYREIERADAEAKDIDEMNEEQERQRAEEQPPTPTDVDDLVSPARNRRSPLAQTPSTQTDSFDLEVQQWEEVQCSRRQSGHYLPIEIGFFHCVCGNCFCGSCKRPGEWSQKENRKRQLTHSNAEMEPVRKKPATAEAPQKEHGGNPKNPSGTPVAASPAPPADDTDQIVMVSLTAAAAAAEAAARKQCRCVRPLALGSLTCFSAGAAST